MTTDPFQSLAYGVLVFAVSVAVIAGLILFGWDFILFPALAGFMIVGPLLAIGLYEKSRKLATGKRSSLAQMIFVRPQSGGQVLFTGVVLCLLMLLWLRAAVSSTHCSSDYNLSRASITSPRCYSQRLLVLRCWRLAARSAACLLRFLSQSAPFQFRCN
jgi:uncharacterized membrane protein